MGRREAGSVVFIPEQVFLGKFGLLTMANIIIWYQWTPINLPINVLTKEKKFGLEFQKLKFSSKMPVSSTKISKLSWS